VFEVGRRGGAVAIELTDDLVKLERRGLEEEAKAKAVSYAVSAWAPWLKAAQEVDAAITAYTRETEQNRLEVPWLSAGRLWMRWVSRSLVAAMDEPEQAPPWRSEDGDPPAAWPWPAGQHPVLRVRIDGRSLRSQVLSRIVHADGRVAYRVVVTPPPGGGYERTYLWPQEGKLRLAWKSSGRTEQGA
jgi:hypothetical protein